MLLSVLIIAYNFLFVNLFLSFLDNFSMFFSNQITFFRSGLQKTRDRF